LKIIFEATDPVPSILHDRYCYDVHVQVMPDKLPKVVVRDAWRGAAVMVPLDEVEVVYPGAEPAQAEPVAVEEKPKAKRARATKQKVDPALTGPRLQDNSWMEE
jgi:hypothetical protein